MSLLRNLFGQAQPCDLCQLGKVSWPSDRNATADWKIWGHGLRADLRICSTCKRTLRDTPFANKPPILGLAYLVTAGMASRPPVHAYLQHPEWRKVWMHALEGAGIHVSDEFEALDAVRTLEAKLISEMQEHNQHPPRQPPGASADEVIERVKRNQPLQVDPHELGKHLISLTVQASDLLYKEITKNYPENWSVRLTSLDCFVEVFTFNLFLIDSIAARAFPERADAVRAALNSEVDLALGELTGANPYARGRERTRFVHYRSAVSRADNQPETAMLGEAAAGNILDFVPTREVSEFLAEVAVTCTLHVEFIQSAIGRLDRAYLLI